MAKRAADTLVGMFIQDLVFKRQVSECCSCVYVCHLVGRSVVGTIHSVMDADAHALRIFNINNLAKTTAECRFARVALGLAGPDRLLAKALLGKLKFSPRVVHDNTLNFAATSFVALSPR